jgi:hypothetical protein
MCKHAKAPTDQVGALTQTNDRSIPLCAECGHQQAEGFNSMCTGCHSDYMARQRRRRDAERRLQPLADFWASRC